MGKAPRLVRLGAHIRALRIARGFSQESLAFEAGLDRSYYGGIERGERNVAALNLIQLASVLAIEVGDLFPRMSDLNEASRHGRKIKNPMD